MPWEKQFDRQEVLERAMRAFWSQGYEATSMTALLDQMGIQKGSFYATFGSKHQVLLEALEVYLRDRIAEFTALKQASSPRQALERHLAEVADEACGREGSLGCFLMNTALELAPRDAAIRSLAQRALASHKRIYQELLAAAQDQGEVSADLDPKGTAGGLLALVLGMRALGRASVPQAVIAAARDQALRLIDH